MRSIRKPFFALAAGALLAALGGSLVAAPAPATQLAAAPAAAATTPPAVWLVSQLGTCRTLCSGNGTQQFVNWVTTESQCCSGTGAPCPPGTSQQLSTFQPNGGGPRRCAA